MAADFLRSWIMNITVIITFVMLLETVMPQSSMKRYINVVIGLLIIIAVTKPFVFIKDYAENFNKEVAAAASFIEGSGTEEKSREISRYQRAKALEIFESNIKDKVRTLVEDLEPESRGKVKVNLEIDSDFESENFGRVKTVKVSIMRDRTAAIEVDKIKIGGPGNSNENKNVINRDKGEYNLNDRQLWEGIADSISRTLGVSKAGIIVEVQQ